MLVVFDTNVWKSDLYLRSQTASAVKAYLKLKGANVGLPEVVELEVKHHLLADLKTYRDRVRDDHNRLLALFKKLKEVVLPTDDEIGQLVEQSIGSIGLPLVRVPFSNEAARSSFERTIDKRRPSHKSQQFKDGVLWEDCKSLAEKMPVIFVSNDRAFFEDDKLDKGLAKELRDEIEAENLDLKLLPSLAELLIEIRQPVPVPLEQLKSDLDNQLGEQFDRHVENNGFARSKDGEFAVQHYATEDPSLLFVEISGVYACEDVSGSGRTAAGLKFSCDGSFNIEESNFVGLSLTELDLSYRSEEGQEQSRRNHIIRTGGIVIGAKTVEHQVRHKLEQ